MDIDIKAFTNEDIGDAYRIQRAAYKPLYEKYSDSGNPYLESLETVLSKYTRKDTCGYIFKADGAAVGCVRVVTRGDVCKISGLAVLPAYQNRKIAQTALRAIELKFPSAKRWVLDTVLQESGNCHLYEKLGYKRTGDIKAVNGLLTLVYYEKIKT